MAEPITNVLGIVGMENKGAYDADAYYEKLNVVSYQGSSYCALDSVHNVLPTDTTKWQLIAEKGDKGDTGAAGYTPVKGTDYYTAADKADLESDLASDVTTEVTEQLGDLTSATPLVASSTAGMSDTTRIYVNTTDGHWYWYNGDEWTDGGIYQAASVQGQINEEIGEKITTFTTVVNTTTTKSIKFTKNIPANTYIECKLSTTSDKINNYGIYGITSGGTPLLKGQVTVDEKVIVKTTENLTGIYFICSLSGSVADNEVTPYIYIYGNLKEGAYTNTNDIDELKKSANLSDSQLGKVYKDFTVVNTTTTLKSVRIVHEFNIGDVIEARIDSENEHITSWYLYGITSGDSVLIKSGLELNTDYVFEIEQQFTGLYYIMSTTETIASDSFEPTLYIYGINKKDTYKNSKDIKRLNSEVDISLYNSKILVMGDSISADYYGSYKKWVTNLIDEGVFDSDKVTNNSIHATGFVATYQTNDDFNTRLQAVENKNTFDLVVTFGGVNDFIQNIAWSDFTSAVDSYLEYLVKNFTQARLVVLSPLRTISTSQNTQGKYLTDYCDYIKQKAKYYSLPVLNLTDESGFCPYISEFNQMWTLQPQGFESHDGVHPNADYEKKYLAPMIKGFLQDLIHKDSV